MARRRGAVNGWEDGPDADHRPPFIHSSPHGVSPLGPLGRRGRVLLALGPVVLVLLLALR